MSQPAKEAVELNTNLSQNGARKGPLAGIRVVDMTRILAGPWATQTLADMGADVIKVERPGQGDDTRAFAPFIASGDGTTRESAYFQSANRGKRSITIDVTTAEGQELVRQLADKADIFIENFKVGSLKNWGLDHCAMSARNPRLIYCSITGFGQTGPHKDRVSYDLVIQAMGGLMSITGEPGREPMKSGVAIVDILTGLYASTAILAALHERERSNLGQYIDLALLDVQIATLANKAAGYLMTGNTPQRDGNSHESITPYQVFATSDGQMVVAVANDLQFARLAKAIGAPGLAGDPKFQTNRARLRNREELLPIISERLLKRKSREWMEDFDEAQVPAGPINSLDAVFDDPQIPARDLLVEFPPDGNSAPIRVAGNPIRFSRNGLSYDAPPPKLGAHTEQILSGLLDMNDEAILALRKKRVI
jgi:crotonobetainyl-CoA:carnitine CoA-transferase CaiB-like acyl-CoA transferase